MEVKNTLRLQIPIKSYRGPWTDVPRRTLTFREQRYRMAARHPPAYLARSSYGCAEKEPLGACLAWSLFVVVNCVPLCSMGGLNSETPKLARFASQDRFSVKATHSNFSHTL